MSEAGLTVKCVSICGDHGTIYGVIRQGAVMFDTATGTMAPVVILEPGWEFMPSSINPPAELGLRCLASAHDQALVMRIPEYSMALGKDHIERQRDSEAQRHMNALPILLDFIKECAKTAQYTKLCIKAMDTLRSWDKARQRREPGAPGEEREARP